MPSAAVRPSKIAVTTRSEPRTMSPPAKIFGLLVWCLNCAAAGAMTRPWLSISTWCCSNQGAGLGRKPKAISTASAGMISSEPGIGSGLRRPRASGSPRRVSTTFTPSTLSSPTMAMGWRLKRNFTPSSLAFFTSLREPGMFSSSRR